MGFKLEWAGAQHRCDMHINDINRAADEKTYRLTKSPALIKTLVAAADNPNFQSPAGRGRWGRGRGGRQQQAGEGIHFPPEFLAFVQQARRGLNRVLRSLPDALNGHLSFLLRMPGTSRGMCVGVQWKGTSIKLFSKSKHITYYINRTDRRGGDGAKAGARGGAARAASARLADPHVEPVRVILFVCLLEIHIITHWMHTDFTRPNTTTQLPGGGRGRGL